MQPLFYSNSTIPHYPQSYADFDQVYACYQNAAHPYALLLMKTIQDQFSITSQLIHSQQILFQQLRKDKGSSDSSQSSNNPNPNTQTKSKQGEDLKFIFDHVDHIHQIKNIERTHKQQLPLNLNNYEWQEMKSQESQQSFKSRQKMGQNRGRTFGRLRSREKKPSKHIYYESSSQVDRKSICCETKNIIKNFIKSLRNFIHKYPSYISSVLKIYNINQQQFLKATEVHQCQINTISELRSLWIQQPYAKVYRTISSHFLRKYCPRHIFHSRILNFIVHLKYRGKLMRCLQNPFDFTSLKENF